MTLILYRMHPHSVLSCLSNFPIIASKTFYHKLLIEPRDTAAEGGLGAGAGEHVAAVADKQRRKKSVLYRRCECASCRSWSRPVSDV